MRTKWGGGGGKRPIPQDCDVLEGAEGGKQLPELVLADTGRQHPHKQLASGVVLAVSRLHLLCRFVVVVVCEEMVCGEPELVEKMLRGSNHHMRRGCVYEHVMCVPLCAWKCVES